MTKKKKDKKSKVLRHIYSFDPCCFLCGNWTSENVYILYVQTSLGEKNHIVCGTCLVALHRFKADRSVESLLSWNVVNKLKGA